MPKMTIFVYLAGRSPDRIELDHGVPLPARGELFSYSPAGSPSNAMVTRLVTSRRIVYEPDGTVKVELDVEDKTGVRLRH